MNKETKKIIIIGAGPAGLSAANELILNGVQGTLITIIDLGPDIAKRVTAREKGDDSYNTIGTGGAGLFSDGKLAAINEDCNLFPSDKDIVGMWEALPNNEISEEETKNLYKYSYELYESLGVKITGGEVANEDIIKMQKDFDKNGIHFEYYESRQISPKDLTTLISNFKNKLVDAGVTFMLETQVQDIFLEQDGSKTLKCISNNELQKLSCTYLVFATGKRGMKWVVEQLKKQGLQSVYRPIEIGVRVEVPKKVMDPFTAIHRDLQLINKYDKNTLVQTFCTCSGGKVLECRYGDFTLIGGYTDVIKTENTNFALLVKLNLDKDIDALAYGQAIINTANIIGKGKPIVQKLSDLKQNKTSSAQDIDNNLVKPTLINYTLENIATAFPKIIIDALLTTLDSIDKVIKGVNSDTTIISAPCMEFCYKKVAVNKFMETAIDNLYISGDVAGYESGIIPASASGILAARGIINKLKATH